jgi:hypothetical protein
VGHPAIADVQPLETGAGYTTESGGPNMAYDSEPRKQLTDWQLFNLPGSVVKGVRAHASLDVSGFGAVPDTIVATLTPDVGSSVNLSITAARSSSPALFAANITKVQTTDWEVLGNCGFDATNLGLPKALLEFSLDVTSPHAELRVRSYLAKILTRVTLLDGNVRTLTQAFHMVSGGCSYDGLRRPDSMDWRLFMTERGSMLDAFIYDDANAESRAFSEVKVSGDPDPSPCLWDVVDGSLRVAAGSSRKFMMGLPEPKFTAPSFRRLVARCDVSYQFELLVRIPSTCGWYSPYPKLLTVDHSYSYQ